MKKEEYMKEALKEAEIAYQENEVPIGCVIVKDDEIIARAHNIKVQTNNTINHAEIVAINMASDKLNSWYLNECELYVSLEPCIMCTGAIINSRIKKVYFATKDPKGGGFVSNLKIKEIPNLNHYPEFEYGILEDDASLLLKSFFKEKRRKK